MSRSGPRLYDLLPAYIRFRDAYEGKPLEEVMDVLEIPFEILRQDIDALYCGWFIETCEEWLVPYIGDLVGVPGLETRRQMIPSQRTRVANTLAYRRSKGTAAALERVARDVTGWACHLVEYRQSLAATASLLDAARGRSRTADLRRTGDLDALGGPFNVLAHSADLKPARNENPPLGDPHGFSPPNLGLAFWRLESFPVAGGTPRLAAGGQAGCCYTFHPFGLDIPLFNQPQTADRVVYSSSERHLPVPLRRKAPDLDLFRADPVFQILVHDGRAFRPIPPEEMEMRDLSHWTLPGRSPAQVFVDPVLGRFAFPAAIDGRRVRVSYSYGASMDLGGGPYPRNIALLTAAADTWRAVVAGDVEPGYDSTTGVLRFRTLTDALRAWSGRPFPIPPPQQSATAPQKGIIQIADSGCYKVELPVDVTARSLTIRAAYGCCPTLVGPVEVGGASVSLRPLSPHRSPSEGSFAQDELSLSGLWIEDGIRLYGSTSLYLEHCTVDPPRAGRPARNALELSSAAAWSPGEEPRAAERRLIKAHRSILGPISLRDRLFELELTDCLVDAAGGEALAAGRTTAQIDRSTILGDVRLEHLDAATNVLFTGSVIAQGHGVVRFCHLPQGVCPPPGEELTDSTAYVPATSGAVVFTATTFGHPAYGQLSPQTSQEIRQGAEDGNEIGVYNRLRQSDRLANLPSALDEFLPWGMTARVFFVT